jgi:hypothetical protein
MILAIVVALIAFAMLFSPQALALFRAIADRILEFKAVLREFDDQFRR